MAKFIECNEKPVRSSRKYFVNVDRISFFCQYLKHENITLVRFDISPDQTTGVYFIGSTSEFRSKLQELNIKIA